MSPKIYATFSGSDVRSCARGMVSLRDLCKKGVFAVVPGAADAGKSGLVGGSGPARGELQVKACSSCCMGPCRMHATEEAGKGEFACGRTPEPEGVHGEVS